MKALRVLLVLVAVVCIGVAVSYPIRYQLALKSTNEEMQDLSEMRKRVRDSLETAGSGSEQSIDDGQSDLQVRADATERSFDEGQSMPTQQSGTVIDASGQMPAEGQIAPAWSGDAAAPGPAEGQGTAIWQGSVEGQGTAAQPQQSFDGAGGQVPVEGRGDAAQPGPAEGQSTAIWQGSVEGRSESADEQSAPERMPDDGTAAKPDAVTPAPTPVPTPSPTPGIMDLIINEPEMITPVPTVRAGKAARVTPEPSPTPDRSIRLGALAYTSKEKKTLDVENILPELREIYELNHDLVGWIYIEDTNIDFPVVQTEDTDFYLKHDFYGESNSNGQIILDIKCDPYTPSYNLVISGHHMNSGAMFGRLPLYRDKKYWSTHKIMSFDTLMERKEYVIFAAFYSADYDKNEKGFRYNADIQYKMDADMWLGEIAKNQIYDTGIDVEFGDEFVTLTTCERSRRKNGRFVVVARRIREGETIE